MAEIDDPDDYETIQRNSQAAMDDYLIDPERWEAERQHEKPTSFSSGLRTPRGASRGGYSYGVFELTAPATCAACGALLLIGQQVIGRKAGRKWLIHHLHEQACDRIRTEANAATKSLENTANTRTTSQTPERAPGPPWSPPAAATVERGGLAQTDEPRRLILGEPCAACGLPMRSGEALRFDHTATAFVHRQCLGD